MLRKLFKRKPRLDATDPHDRISALAELDDGEQETFARLFLTDAEREVRLAALERLTRIEPLVQGLADDAVAEPAVARLLALMDDGTPAAARQHPAVLRAQLANAETPDAALAIATQIADLSERATALGGISRTNVRLAVAEAIWHPALLAELEKSARSRDKSLHRIARERLTQLKTASARRQQQDAQTEKLVADAVALGDEDPHHDARRDAIEHAWTQHLAAVEATDAQLARFGVVSRDLSALRHRFPARRESPKELAVDASIDFEPLLAQAETLLESASATIAAGLSDNAVAEFEQGIRALNGQWSVAADTKPPREEISVRFHQLIATLTAQARDMERACSLAAKANDLLRREVPGLDQPRFESIGVSQREIRRQSDAADGLLQRYAWPEKLPKPAVLAALEERRHVLAEAAERCEARTEAQAEEVVAGLAELRQSLDRGAVQEAVGQDRRLHELVRRLPRPRAERFNAELDEAGARIRELRDWRTYAEAPKREALCRQMAELADRPLEIDEQAEAVKSLRLQWNDLGAVDSHRDRELKKRFDRAAERAFEPCRIHFKEQAEQRAFNFKQRQAIVEALDGYLANNDWQQADWRGVEKVLRQARVEWRSYHPVDRKAGRELAARFHDLTSRIHALLKEEWERNIGLKRAIIEEAAQVRDSPDTATDKAEAMKNLQRRWQRVGAVPHGADQRLWKLFRANCDVVFEARNAVRHRHVQRSRAIEEAGVLLAELERRMDLDPALDRNIVADYEQRLHDLGALPKNVQQRVESILQEADRAVVARRGAASAD